MARGEGAVVSDVDGNVYLDCCAGIAVAATGHSHPDVVRAVADQASRYLHISTDYYHEPQVALGELLSELAPVGGRAKTFFSNSGAEAVEAAIKLARYHTRRVSSRSSAVPWTHASLVTASRSPAQRFGPMVPGVYTLHPKLPGSDRA
jgi:4-aminobutyrate aminotransferase